MTDVDEWIAATRAMRQQGLTPRAANCLVAGGVLTREQAALMSPEQLLRLPNVGRLAMAEIYTWTGRTLPTLPPPPPPSRRQIANARALLVSQGFTVTKERDD